MKFKKIYIEVSNSCNFSCSFCFQSERSKRFMKVDEFRFIVNRIREFTDYIYLHVLGEPLLHPCFREFLEIASDVGLKVNITTNGSLLKKQIDYLLENPVRQLNISLHDAEENIPENEWKNYLISMFDFAKNISEKSFVNFRLWNQTNEASDKFNLLCINTINSAFATSIPSENIGLLEKSITLAPNIYLQLARRFEWTDAGISEKKSCYGLRDQIAILSDGNVIPCCIDADANVLLGNIYQQRLEEILKTERAKRIKKGFEQHRAVEEWCQKCGFRV